MGVLQGSYPRQLIPPAQLHRGRCSGVRSKVSKSRGGEQVHWRSQSVATAAGQAGMWWLGTWGTYTVRERALQHSKDSISATWGQDAPAEGEPAMHWLLPPPLIRGPHGKCGCVWEGGARGRGGAGGF